MKTYLIKSSFSHGKGWWNEKVIYSVAKKITFDKNQNSSFISDKSVCVNTRKDKILRKLSHYLRKVNIE